MRHIKSMRKKEVILSINMNKKGHWILGAVLCLLLIFITDYLGLNWYSFTLYSVPVMIFIIGFYSILPDMDHKGSTITWWFFGIGILGLIIGILLLLFKSGGALSILLVSTIFLIVVFISAKVVAHRGFIHTVQVGIASTIPLWFIFHSFSYCVLAYVAWHSHLMGDGYFFKTR